MMWTEHAFIFSSKNTASLFSWTHLTTYCPSSSFDNFLYAPFCSTSKVLFISSDVCDSYDSQS